MARRNTLVLLSIISLLLVLSLACKQAGEIITPAEATQRYEATQAASVEEVVGDAEGAEFLGGDSAKLVGQGYLVGLFNIVGETVAFSFATRGDTVTVIGSVVYEDGIWYKVQTLAGSGWLPAENLAPVQ